MVEHLMIETETEDDGRWLAEIRSIPGVLAYGETREQAVASVKAPALRVLADRFESGEQVPEAGDLFRVAS